MRDSRGRAVRARFTVPGRFPGLNDYVRACRCLSARARMKRDCDARVAAACVEAGCPRFDPPVSVTLDCYEADMRRDADNVHGMAAKFVLDGMRGAGVIGNDSRSWVPQPPGGGVFVGGEPRVEVTVEGEVIPDGERR